MNSTNSKGVTHYSHADNFPAQGQKQDASAEVPQQEQLQDPGAMHPSPHTDLQDENV